MHWWMVIITKNYVLMVINHEIDALMNGDYNEELCVNGD